MTCPHPGLLVSGRCYWCLKLAALNGGRDGLSPEQLEFVGFTERRRPRAGWHAAAVDAWEHVPLQAFERRVAWTGRDTLVYELKPETAQEVADRGEQV